jgi:DNA-directed RNA polymerase subunit beta'
VSIEEGDIVVIHEERREAEYEIPVTARMTVAEGDIIQSGTMVTEGTKNPHQILQILGVEAVRDYMITEIQQVYRTQGVTINDKHIETIIRQMLRKVQVIESGDTEMLPGELIDRFDFEDRNAVITERGGEPATAEPVVLGITKAALNTESFLSAASFQHTISVLANAAIEGKIDDLRGLKESVLIGKLIPAGTGFRTEEAEAEEMPEEGELVLETAGEDILAGLGEGMLSSDIDSELDALDAAFLASGGRLGGTPPPELEPQE